MIDPPIEFRFRRVASIRRIEERCRRHAIALLPRTGDIEGCKVTVSRAVAADGVLAPYDVRVEVRRTGGEVLVDRASAPPAGERGNDEDLVVQTVDEALHRMRRNLARADFGPATPPSDLGTRWRPVSWSTRSAGSGEIWYG